MYLYLYPVFVSCNIALWLCSINLLVNLKKRAQQPSYNAYFYLKGLSTPRLLPVYHILFSESNSNCACIFIYSFIYAPYLGKK